MGICESRTLHRIPEGNLGFHLMEEGIHPRYGES